MITRYTISLLKDELAERRWELQFIQRTEPDNTQRILELQTIITDVDRCLARLAPVDDTSEVCSPLERVLDYCESRDAQHMLDAEDNARHIRLGQYDQLSGCPSNFGLPNFAGLCITEPHPYGWHQEDFQCIRCWMTALGKNAEVDG